MADSFFGFNTQIPSYEDEDLAVVDPSLANLEDDIDLLNDDTFGTGASVDDWEEAHRKLAGLDLHGEDKPAWNDELSRKKLKADDDTNLEEEEEILEQCLAKLVDEDDLEEPNKAYAATGYKDIPAPSVISSAWDGSSPLSSPTSSDSLHDLINPATNIWASPDHSQIFKETANATPKSVQSSDKKPNRRPYSPAFEDDAIIEALPKPTENLLPPSSFTKKVPTTAIRLEDLEKEFTNESPHSMGQQETPRPSMIGRPPPGLPPPPMMRSPQVLHGYPPMPFPQHASQIYPRASSPGPGLRPFPRTPQMFQNQQMYNKQPLPPGMGHRQGYPGTPPPRMQNQLFGKMRSDPAHLMRRLGLPNQPRFSTPPSNYQNPNMRSPYPDNRYMNQRYNNYPKQHQQQQQQNQHQPTDLEKKIHSILTADENLNNKDRYAGLMTRKEKEWIIKIQLLQLTSSNPNMDDYYFQTHESRKRAKERAKRGEGVEFQYTGGQTQQMALPQFDREERHYKPLDFQNTLGKVSASHISHPREMVQVPNNYKDLDQEKGTQGSSIKETRRRRRIMIVIDKAYDIQLQLDDLDSKLLESPAEQSNSIMEAKQDKVDKLFQLLKLNAQDELSNNDAELIIQVMSVRKGKVLISRLLHYFKQAQAEAILQSICRNIVMVIKKDNQDELLPLLINPLGRVVDVATAEVVFRSLKYVVYGNNDPASPLSSVLANQFGIAVLSSLLKKANSSTFPSDNKEEYPKTWDAIVSQVAKEFSDVPVKLLAKNMSGVTPLVTVLGSCDVAYDKSSLQEHYRLALSTREELKS
ncbi:protein PAT1 homolog 1-like isoform X2 [Actinia tenebrosa]|uniref:Protein PAT1 homolog 1-like isoform X2 n=1 Tax=Actinia tenebrosa TaxID=6105 RepID=A0A6P8J461_ACTTE|nr:protein PAT1 homolog 1-like isoform X2 [Actinia tenebrosa]